MVKSRPEISDSSAARYSWTSSSASSISTWAGSMAGAASAGTVFSIGRCPSGRARWLLREGLAAIRAGWAREPVERQGVRTWQKRAVDGAGLLAQVYPVGLLVVALEGPGILARMLKNGPSRKNPKRWWLSWREALTARNTDGTLWTI